MPTSTPAPGDHRSQELTQACPAGSVHSPLSLPACCYRPGMQTQLQRKRLNGFHKAPPEARDNCTFDIGMFLDSSEDDS